MLVAYSFHSNWVHKMHLLQPVIDANEIYRETADSETVLLWYGQFLYGLHSRVEFRCGLVVSKHKGSNFIKGKLT